MMKKSILNNIGKEILFNFASIGRGWTVEGKIIRVNQDKEQLRLRWTLDDGQRKYRWFHQDWIRNIRLLKRRQGKAMSQEGRAAERLERLCRVLCMTPSPRPLCLSRGNGKWWLTGPIEGDCPLPQTQESYTESEALDAAEAWLAPEIDNYEPR